MRSLPGYKLRVTTARAIAEYAQVGLNKGQRFQMVPAQAVAQEWQGAPIAFIRSDFEFYTAAKIFIPQQTVWFALSQNQVASIRIRFRYDKSSTNFAYRLFMATGNPILCPVCAGASLIHRANQLGVGDREPIAAHTPFRRSDGSYIFLRDYTIQSVLREACVLTYSDPSHYLRLHVGSLTGHSLRGTAALCLHLAGN